MFKKCIKLKIVYFDSKYYYYISDVQKQVMVYLRYVQWVTDS